MSEMLQARIHEAEQFTIINGMAPAVYKATLLDGSEDILFGFVPVSKKVGDKFHFDHGAGIQRNEDAKIIWKMEETA